MKPTPDRQQIPVPGTYIRPGGKALNPDAYPIAGPTDDPGIVISPYSHSRVDVSHVTEGTLVLDPAFKMADKKYFRVPADPRRQHPRTWQAVPALRQPHPPGELRQLMALEAVVPAV
jgi:hypothetical protein